MGAPVDRAAAETRLIYGDKVGIETGFVRTGGGHRNRDLWGQGGDRDRVCEDRG